LMGDLMPKWLLLLLMGCDQFIAFGNYCIFLLNNCLFDVLVLLLCHISQFFKLPSPLFDTGHSCLLHSL
jgi:hypothetical protein